MTPSKPVVPSLFPRNSRDLIQKQGTQIEQEWNSPNRKDTGWEQTQSSFPSMPDSAENQREKELFRPRIKVNRKDTKILKSVSYEAPNSKKYTKIKKL